MEVETYPLVGLMLSPCLKDVVVQSRIGLSAGKTGKESKQVRITPAAC
jgi:hypothetical protein